VKPLEARSLLTTSCKRKY